jgi:hypothetical protein
MLGHVDRATHHLVQEVLGLFCASSRHRHVFGGTANTQTLEVPLRFLIRHNVPSHMENYTLFERRCNSCHRINAAFGELLDIYAIIIEISALNVMTS